MLWSKFLCGSTWELFSWNLSLWDVEVRKQNSTQLVWSMLKDEGCISDSIGDRGTRWQEGRKRATKTKSCAFHIKCSCLSARCKNKDCIQSFLLCLNPAWLQIGEKPLLWQTPPKNLLRQILKYSRVAPCRQGEEWISLPFQTVAWSAVIHRTIWKRIPKRYEIYQWSKDPGWMQSNRM